MPSQRSVLASAAVGAVSVVGTLLITNWVNSAEQGSEALEEQRIRAVVESVMDDKLTTTINGETYSHSEALSLIHSQAVATKVQTEALTAFVEALQ